MFTLETSFWTYQVKDIIIRYVVFVTPHLIYKRN